jgi:hypothetical protein
VKHVKLSSGRLYQFTAIDEATRCRVLKIYDHNSIRSAIDFVDKLRYPCRRTRGTQARSARSSDRTRDWTLLRPISFCVLFWALTVKKVRSSRRKTYRKCARVTQRPEPMWRNL